MCTASQPKKHIHWQKKKKNIKNKTCTKFIFMMTKRDKLMYIKQNFCAKNKFPIRIYITLHKGKSTIRKRLPRENRLLKKDKNKFPPSIKWDGGFHWILIDIKEGLFYIHNIFGSNLLYHWEIKKFSRLLIVTLPVTFLLISI